MVAQARQAYTSWRASTPGIQARLLLPISDLVAEHADELARVEVEKTGKPAPVMRDAELPFAVDNLRFFEDAAR